MHGITHTAAKIIFGLVHLLDIGIHGHRFEGGGGSILVSSPYATAQVVVSIVLFAQRGEVRVCQTLVRSQATVRVEVQHALQQRESLLARRGVLVGQQLIEYAIETIKQKYFKMKRI